VIDMPKNNNSTNPRPQGKQSKNQTGKRDSTLASGKKGDKK
jgi:hypothetical protein